MKKTFFMIIGVLLFSTSFLIIKNDFAFAQTTGTSPCISDPVTFSGVEKRLLPLAAECLAKTGQTYCGRGEQVDGEYAPSPACVTPEYIVLHTTHGDLTSDAIYNYFASGSEGRHVGSHFGIGQDGKIVQMIEMGNSQVEYGQAVGGFKPHISIEMGAPGNYGGKNEAPPEQYASALKLVKSLMEQYNIPLERVVGHYDLAPGWAGDPGSGWMTDFKADLPNATPLSASSSTSSGQTSLGSGSRTSTSCFQTQVGTPSGPKPTLPPECFATNSSSSGGGTGGIPTAGDYNLPLNKADIVSMTTEMGAYGGDFQYGGHTEHAGLDIDTQDGLHQPVFAVTDGTVDGIYTGGDEVSPDACVANDAGCTIRLPHAGDGLTSWYTHVDPSVSKGQKVTKGQQIGVVHAWPYPNDHLHLELRETATNQNIQPRNYFPDLQIVPVAPGYDGDIRAHSRSRGIELLDDGREFAERFKYHPPCIGFGYDCWAF